RGRAWESLPGSGRSRPSPTTPSPAASAAASRGSGAPDRKASWCHDVLAGDPAAGPSGSLGLSTCGHWAASGWYNSLSGSCRMLDPGRERAYRARVLLFGGWWEWCDSGHRPPSRSEEHTSELQSRFDLVCRLLLEKKNQISLSATHCLMSVFGPQEFLFGTFPSTAKTSRFCTSAQRELMREPLYSAASTTRTPITT